MPALSTESQKVCFQRGLAATIKDNGFSDVTLITGETEALGHGIYVDDKSIDGLMTLLMGRSIPGYLTHEGAMFGDRLGKEIGIFSGFYRDGNKLKAKQFRFLNSFVKNDAETYEKLVELAKELPEQFGLSVVFSGRAVWAMQDGEDIDADVPMPEGAMRGIPSVRFESIESADFVKAPAANPGGLFAARVDEQAGSIMADQKVTVSFSGQSYSGTDWINAVATDTSAVNSTQSFFAYSEDMEAKLSKALAAKDTEHTAALAAKDTEHIKALAAVDAKLTAAMDKLGAAEVEIAKLAAKLADAEAFDMRKAGAPHDAAPSANTQEPTLLPEPAKTDRELWAQYHALAVKDKALAEQFKAKHMTADRYLSRR